MCGIIGYIGVELAQDFLLKGLKRMEYRGYDSSGIATIEAGDIKTTKAVGNVSKLLDAMNKNEPHKGVVGIGHTRWATHGEPSDVNAHPHRVGSISVVHNGIVENYIELRKSLEQKGYEFISATDTEVLAALIDSEYSNDSTPSATLKSVLPRIRGSFGLAVLFKDQPDLIAVARRSSPILIAQNGNATFIASDQYALAGHASNATVLQDDEVALCTPGSVEVYSLTEQPIGDERLEITADKKAVGKDGYRHFMQKEIFEQPATIARTLSGRLHEQLGSSQLGEINLTPRQLRGVKSLIFVGCGTAYNAGLTAKYLLEPLIKIPISVEIASEFRYRNVSLFGSELAVAISQSGETADTIACVEELQLKGIPTLGIVNVVGSTIPRMVDGGIYTHAGPEISVASTKAFSSQVATLLLLGLYLARQRGTTLAEGQKIVHELSNLPELVKKVLAIDKEITEAAHKLMHLPHLMTLGRDTLYPIATETALKIKEVTYIPTLAYAAGEMKHGPNALLGGDMGVLYMHGQGALEEKSLNNLSEVRARNAQLVIFTDTELDSQPGELVVRLPSSSKFAQGLVFAIAGQLLAYHMAVGIKRDVDRPRNLAKSVTVE